MGQLLLVLLARSAASGPEMGQVLKAAAAEAAELANHGFATERREGTTVARRAANTFATPLAPTSPTAPPLPLAAGAARAAIWSAAQMVAEEVETGPALIPCGNSDGCLGAKEPGVHEEFGFGAEAGLSAEVAALVHAAKAKEWTPEVAVPSTTPQMLDGAFLRREAHRRWQAYLQMAAQRLEATRTGDAVEEYHLLYEAINQIIAGLQLAAEASQGRGAELSEAFSQVAQLLLRLAKVSEGTPFENEDFLVQAQAASTLGCGNRPYEDRWCDQRQHRRWLQQHGLHHVREQLAPNDTEVEHERFQESWVKYLDLGFAKGLWRSLHDHQSHTFNPSDVDEKKSHFWQLFPTYIMAKDLRDRFSATKGHVCRACRKLTNIVLEKYHEFKISGFANPNRPDEVNNAFFNWQLTHDEEQKSLEGQQVWPELYQDSTFHELKGFAKLNCLEYLQEIYGPKLSEEDFFEQFQLSIWASVTSPARESMGLAFHDHPLALLSGVFYADAGGDVLSERTPTVFADPRGTRAFRYAGQGQRLEPTAPFHRLAYSHAKTGLSLVFPSWLVHGVAPHHGVRDRVVFAYNLHTMPGTTLASWAKTTL